MAKLGITLGADKLIKGKGNYEPTFKNVRGIHIGVVTVMVLLVGWYLLKDRPTVIRGSNGDGATSYVDTQSFQGWKFYQYNSLGAMAGALNGESN